MKYHNSVMEMRNRSLKRQTYEALLSRLLSNDLVPGQILNRRAVAEELGMSVAPVLEAMLQLESEGFLDSIPRKGTQVRLIRKHDVVGMAVVREALECQAARMYCGQRVRDAFNDFQPLAEELDETPAGHPQHWERELEFHARLVGLAECPMLSDEFQRCIHLNMFFAINKLYPNSSEVGRQSHMELITALAESEPDKAEALVRAHVRSGKGSLSEALN